MYFMLSCHKTVQNDSRMKKILKYTIIVIFLGLAAFLSIPANHYIVKALIYQKANIDDYKIFPNRSVTIGEGQQWRVSERYNSYQLSQDQLNYFKQLNTVAYLVVKDTAILFESYWDGYSSASLSNSFSMAKSIVSLLIGCAVQDGKIISLDQSIGDFLPEYKEGEKSMVTIRNLLTMSSGLSWDETYSSLFSMTTRGYYGNNLKRLVLNQHVVAPSGREFSYKSGDSQLLALIVESATGRSVSEYASERLWKPIGAEHEALWSLDREGGTEKAFCCFNSNARDFARIGQLVLNHGAWDGQQVVPEWYLTDATRPAADIIDPDTRQPNQKYGYQWWCLTHNNFNVVYARGILGQYIFVLPQLNAVIVRLGHKRSDSRVNGHPEDAIRYLDFGVDIIQQSL